MTKHTHFEYEANCHLVSACGVSSEKHDYTERDEEVTCPKCLKALGYVTK